VSRKRDRGGEDGPLVLAAVGLQDAFDEIERLTARSVDVDVSTWAEIVRAAALLEKATAAHHRFASHLTDLSASVSALRDRHHAAIEVLAAQAARVDAQRQRHDALEARFAAIAAAALQVDELTKGIAAVDPSDPTAHAAAVSVGFAAVREGLGRAIDEARSVEVAAQDAGLADLGRRAISIRQQLESLLDKLAGVGGHET
jgi:hypothetical protein